jgi:hypothetical protein
MKNTQVYEWHKCFRDGHEMAEIFCATMHAHIGPSQHDASEHPPYYPDLSPPDFFLFARPKCAQKAQRFESVEEVITKMTKAVTEVSKNLPKALRMPGNVFHRPTGQF